MESLHSLKRASAVVAALVVVSLFVELLPAAALTAQAALTVTSTSGTFGAALTLTTSGGSGTGAVTFAFTNGTATGCTVTSGSLSSTSAGTCTVTATKAGDATYNPVSSSATTVTLAAATSTTTLTSSLASPRNVGTSLTFTATVSKIGSTYATGTVNFTLGGASLTGCSAKALSSGVATCMTTALVAGTNSVIATYSGDANYATSTSSTLSFVELTGGTISALGALKQTGGTGKTTLAVSPQHVGDALVLAVGVFSSGSTVSSISGGGSAWQKASATTAGGGDTELWLGAVTATGSSTITVTFSSSVSSKTTELDAQEYQYSSATSTTWALDVAGSASTTGSSTTVTLPPLTPTGTGELYVDYTPVDNQAVAGSTSGFTYDATSSASLYAFDPTVSATVSPTASQTPAGAYVETAALLTATGSSTAASTTTLTASPASPQNPATSLTLTATVTSGATGTVNFQLGGTSLSGCSAKALASGVATCTTTALAAGTNSFVAVYSGDSGYSASSSSTLTYVGLTAQATLTVTSTTGTYGTALTLTTAGGSGTGAVSFVVTNGTATGCAVGSGSLLSTSVGTCSVTATKASDATYQSTSSSATTVTLAGGLASTVSLGASPASPQSVGTSLTLTATVTSGATGTVNFKLGGTSLSGCSAKALASGVATCTTTALAAGTNSFVAVYSGDVTYLTSTSTTLNYTGLATPGAPTNVTAIAQNGNAVVSWTAPTVTNGFAILGYTVTASAAGPNGIPTCTVAALSTSCTVPNLGAGGSVSFTVTATSAGGTGPSSLSSTALTPSLTPSTTALSAPLASPQNIGTPITFVAQVTTGATGTVDFELVVGSTATPIAGCPTQALSSGYASCTTTALVVGATANSVIAVYSGDTNYATSTSNSLNFVVAPATLSSPASSLVITSTAGFYNVALPLTTSGGSGTGAITYSATNGTATGCLVSGSNLTVSSSGTCQVTATQVGDATYLGQSSNVTVVNFYWYYAATLVVVSDTPVFGDVWAQVGTDNVYTQEDVCTVWDSYYAGQCDQYTLEEVLTGTTPVMGWVYEYIGDDVVYGYTCPNGGGNSMTPPTMCSLSGASGPNVRAAHATVPAATLPTEAPLGSASSVLTPVAKLSFYVKPNDGSPGVVKGSS